MREAIKEVARNEQLNAYEVPRDFIVEREPFSVENGLLAGIGKYQRPKFKERYAARLEKLYDDIAASQAERAAELASRRPQCTGAGNRRARRAGDARHRGHRPVARSCSFAELGGDSLSALSCSLLLEEIYGIEVPASVINNPAGSLQQLASYIERARDDTFQRPTFASVHGRGATEIRASDLTLDKFLDASTLEDARASGAAIERDPHGAGHRRERLSRPLPLPRMARTHGARSADGSSVSPAARMPQRRDNASPAAFDSGDPELKRHFEQLAGKHLEVLAGDLSEPDLGLSHRRLAAARTDAST